MPLSTKAARAEGNGQISHQRDLVGDLDILHDNLGHLDGNFLCGVLHLRLGILVLGHRHLGHRHLGLRIASQPLFVRHGRVRLLRCNRLDGGLPRTPVSCEQPARSWRSKHTPIATT